MCEFLIEIISFLVFIPCAVICYLPMKNQLKHPWHKIFLCITAVFAVLIPVAAWFGTVLHLDGNLIALPIFILCFIFFHNTVKTDISRSFAVFVFVCGLAAFPNNFALAFDAWLHPESNYLDFSAEAVLFQLAVTVFMCVLFAYPIGKWGSRLIDRLIVPRVWFVIASVAAVFLLLNISIIPRNYSTLYVGRCFPMYITILFALLLLLIILYIAFYHIAMGILKNARLFERIQFFELQENQYELQQKYIEETSKQRHDFRQSIFTLKELADSGDFSAVKNYLAEYVSAFPEAEIVRYCKNSAVNALLNHYARFADANNISIKWNINLTEAPAISEPDLCSLLGNLIENAFFGCMTLDDKEKRYHFLSVSVSNGVNLYIVSTNSFDGVVKMKDNRYLSTKKNGGIGIHSVEMIAEKYGGTAHFHHKGTEFYADIILRLINDLSA